MEVMIDIETLGVGPTAAVLSIGATAFSAADGKMAPVQFYATLDLNEQESLERAFNADTLLWWMNQAAENPAAAEVFREPKKSVLAELVRLREYLEMFLDKDSGIWANGPDFDLVILRTLYEAVGLEAPWTHRQHRCFRTLKHMAKVVGAPIDVQPNQLYHNALCDAEYQARYACQALQFFGA